MKDFGTRLKIARKKVNKTQKDLALELGVEQSSISNYEKNLRFPPAATLIEISNRLAVSVDYLLGKSNFDESYPEPETSAEVSGSIYSDNLSNASIAPHEQSEDIMVLRDTFIDSLIAGHYPEATDLIMNHRGPGTDLMLYNVHVFEPALKKIGLLWEAGEISIAEEHIITNVITRLMMRLEQDMNERTSPKKPHTVALMLVGAEEHELPLKMIEEVFKHHGWITFYLGKNIPVSSLEDFFRKNKIQVIGLSVSMSSHLNNCEVLVRAIKMMDPAIRPQVMLGGRAIENRSMALEQLGADLYFATQQELYEGLVDIENSLK